MKLNLEPIRAIIFDLGGVLINIDYSLSENALREIGLAPSKGELTQASQAPLFDRFEKGFLSAESFRTQLKTMLPQNTTDVELDKAWNAMLLDFPKERLQLLKKLSKKYRLFLLSNTNVIHIHEVNRKLKKMNAGNSLRPYFEKIFYSFEVGLRKPDPEIFRHVLCSIQLLPSETLFIDDSPQHIMAAKSLGIHTHLLERGKDVTTLF